jgi:hypothetical protein
MHEDIFKGYRAARGMNLYKGDTVMTLEKSRVRFRMNDGSILSLASETKLKLTKSVYDKKKKRRSSFLRMTIGKARFFVVKMLNFKRSAFKVRTPTAVCGVRGSDFILEATDSETIATALEETELEFQGLAFLEEPPIILKDYETSKVSLGARPTLPFKLPTDAVEEKKELFIEVQPGDAGGVDEDMVDQTGTDDDTGVDEVGDLGDAVRLEDIRPESLVERKEYADFTDKIKPWTPAEIDTIKESVIDSTRALPEFPAVPSEEETAYEPGY